MSALKGAGNTTLSFSGTAITAYCNSTDLSAAVNAIDSTNFSSTGMESDPGLGTFTIAAGGMLTTAIEAIIGPAIIAPAQATAVLGIGAATYTWTTNAFVSDVKMGSSAPSAGQTWTATFTLSGAPVRS